MDLNGTTFFEETENPIHKQLSSGIKVRDMIRRYDSASKSDSTKTSYSSILTTKSAYFGVTSSGPIADTSSNALFLGNGNKVDDLTGSSSKSSCGSSKTVRRSRSPRVEMQNDLQLAAPLETQKSFMNLSRCKEPPKAAPREKIPRHSVETESQQQLQMEQKSSNLDTSFQSKTTISKTPTGVRIIIDILFDQNTGLSIEDVVGSRIETDIPPSKILTDFQKRVAESVRRS